LFSLKIKKLKINFIIFSGQSAFSWARLGRHCRRRSASNILSAPNFWRTNKRKCFRIVGSGNGLWRRPTETLSQPLRQFRLRLLGSDSQACWSFGKTWWLRGRAHPWPKTTTTTTKTTTNVRLTVEHFYPSKTKTKYLRNCSKIVNLFWWKCRKNRNLSERQRIIKTQRKL